MSTHSRGGSRSYLTVAQAAEQLSVHPSSIRRWIDQGRLLAYRIGDKRIGVRPADLARLVAPRRGRPAKRERAVEAEPIVVPRLTKEDQRSGLAAFAELRRLRDQLAAKAGTFAPESWELLNGSRDARTDELARAVER